MYQKGPLLERPSLAALRPLDTSKPGLYRRGERDRDNMRLAAICISDGTHGSDISTSHYPESNLSKEAGLAETQALSGTGNYRSPTVQPHDGVISPTPTRGALFLGQALQRRLRNFQIFAERHK